MKFKTIWHYAIAFFETESELTNESYSVENVKYAGEISKLSYKKAAKIAQIHPNCLRYYQDAMMPLFKGEGKYSKGTENPVDAIESLKTKKQSEIDMPYVLIWKVYK